MAQAKGMKVHATGTVKPPPDSAEMVDDGYLEARVEELEEQLAVTAEERDKAEAEAKRWKPTADVNKWLFEGTADVSARYTDQQLKDIAGAQLAEINRQRLKAGHLPIDYTEEQWAAAIEETKLELVADRTRWVPATGPGHRVLKMVFPTKDHCPIQPCYEHGTLKQIPVENQINNMAGSQTDAIQRYKDKGGKIASPFLCAMNECYEPAAVDKGKFVYAGYCSEDHRSRVEGNQGAVRPNAITAANVI